MKYRIKRLILNLRVEFYQIIHFISDKVSTLARYDWLINGVKMIKLNQLLYKSGITQKYSLKDDKASTLKDKICTNITQTMI